jgi:lipoprotein-anchoring transpeptidase ErfK/SrfK
MFKKAILVIVIFMSFNIFAENNLTIEIDISKQRLFLLDNMEIVRSYPISSSKYGEGSTQNSFKTPLGNHVIKEMIGNNAIKNTIFTSRINTKRQAEIIHDEAKSDNDYVTTRIMWLDGQEEGKNKGKGVDSYQRYIYIHGTHEEGLIGQKASHGCIRMFNSDVIELFNDVKKGTKVYIKA